MNKQGERIYLWDNIKLFLIVCVVAGHTILSLNPGSELLKKVNFFIYSFHMPLFVFVSGLFSKKAVISKNYKPVVDYIYIYLFIKVYGFVFSSLFWKRIADFSLLNASGMEWFMLAVGYGYLVTMIVKDYNKIFVFVCSIVIACCVGYDSTIGDFLALSRCIVFFPFFYAGYCFEGNKLVQFLQRKYIRLIAIASLIVELVVIQTKYKSISWYWNVFTGHSSFHSLKKYSELGGVARFSWYIIAFVLCFSIISIVPNKEMFFSKNGSRTLPVYVFHGTLMYMFRYKLGIHEWLNDIWSVIGFKWVLPLVLFIVFVLSEEHVNNVLMKILRLPKLDNRIDNVSSK